MNGLVAARSAPPPQVGQRVDGGNMKPPNAAEAALLPIFPPGKKEGGFCYSRSLWGCSQQMLLPLFGQRALLATGNELTPGLESF